MERVEEVAEQREAESEQEWRLWLAFATCLCALPEELLQGGLRPSAPFHSPCIARSTCLAPLKAPWKDEAGLQLVGGGCLPSAQDSCKHELSSPSALQRLLLAVGCTCFLGLQATSALQASLCHDCFITSNKHVASARTALAGLSCARPASS